MKVYQEVTCHVGIIVMTGVLLETVRTKEVVANRRTPLMFALNGLALPSIISIKKILEYELSTTVLPTC